MGRDTQDAGAYEPDHHDEEAGDVLRAGIRVVPEVA